MTRQHDAKKIGYAMEMARVAGLDFNQRKFRDARDKFLAAHRADPASADYVNNLAACQLELGEYGKAVVSASDAIKLNPNLPFAYVNRADALRQSGRMDRAADDYSKALDLHPDNPVVLTKMGACFHLMNRYRDAREQLIRALDIAPGYSLARVNLGLVAVSEDRPDVARDLIAGALADQRLDRESRQVGETCLALLDENDRVAPHVVASLENGDLSILAENTGSPGERFLRPDSRTIGMFEKLAGRCADLSLPEDAFIHPGSTRNLPFVEAYANCLLPDEESVMVEIFRHPAISQSEEKGVEDGGRNIFFFHELCRARRERRDEVRSAEDGVAMVRYWHARIAGRSAGFYPGRFKAIPNAIGSQCPEPPTPPVRVHASLHRIMAELYGSVPAGPARAVFMLVLLMKLHPFKDGNGRTGRFLFNRELELDGRHAVSIPRSRRKDWYQALNGTFLDLDPQPLTEIMLDLHAETGRRLAMLANHPPHARFASS